ncbi:hypothetical protein [Alteromonas gilva]|uniref:Uncharacterized protein n=1 Tax=Alteromonas gilva TaxID=2987522 RepID=A0ABT5L7G1_9ALTE|nr:hypothetical protein [Alteromonas gilva]MDC8832802.1 hypothetical protein [Alteromonas gilva]
MYQYFTPHEYRQQFIEHCTSGMVKLKEMINLAESMRGFGVSLRMPYISGNTEFVQMHKAWFDKIAQNVQAYYSNDTQATIEAERIFNSCAKAVNIRYRGLELAELSLDDIKEAIITAADLMDFEKMIHLLEREGQGLDSKGRRDAADRLLCAFNLKKRDHRSDYGVKKTATHTTICSHHYWGTLGGYDCSDNKRMSNIVNDIQLVSNECGVPALAATFRSLFKAFRACGYSEHLASRTKFGSKAGAQITVFKEYFKVELTHDVFDALLVFCITHKSDDVNIIDFPVAA